MTDQPGSDPETPQVSTNEEGGDADAATGASYDEQFYAARPRALRPTARRRQFETGGRPSLEADGRNRAYVEWLRNRSMLGDADTLARQLSGQASMWQNPFAQPNPRKAVERAPVWFTAYPLSFITAPEQTFLGALGEPALWRAFREIGISAIHTGPVKSAGGITDWSETPSVDGHFDRISMGIDPVFGTEDEFRSMCEVASAHGGTIIDDIVPGHTGKGADFRLAEMNYRDYPGIYHMIDIPVEDWSLLPDVPAGLDSVNISPEAETALEEAGYIIGQLQRVIFYEPGIKETNWSATRPIYDTAGQLRRWVYLHYFKSGQPSINWLDPTFAGMRLVIGDALHSLVDLGTGGLRLDANGFLGVEKSSEHRPGWSEGHPLSEAANQLIGGMVRKVGGFTFQELNLAIDDIKDTSEVGPDLSYDFVTRPAYHHALVTADTEFLRLTLRLGMAIGVDQASLVHALQNHDELTYELVHFTTRHRDDLFTLGGRELTGTEIAESVQATLRGCLTEYEGSRNVVFTTNGIACTTVSVISSVLGIVDLEAASEEDIAAIRRVHVLLAAFNALQPGVFALSGWDLCGTVPLARSAIQSLVEGGDTRWVHRGAHDLMGRNPGAIASRARMPKARSLYGTLPEQLEDPESFARQLQRIISVRESYGIATGKLVDVPEVSHRGLLVMVHQLSEGELQITVLNFSPDDLAGTVRSEYLQPGSRVQDVLNGVAMGPVDDLHSFFLILEAYRGTAVVVVAPGTDDDSVG